MKFWCIALFCFMAGCSSSSHWLFDDPPTTKVMTEQLVLQMKHPILFAIHDTEGEWFFFTDQRSALDRVEETTLNGIIAIDSSIIQLCHLKRGWKAVRNSKDSSWITSTER